MIHPTQIQDMLQAALETGGDFAEVFVEDRTNGQLGMTGESWIRRCQAGILGLAFGS